MTLRDKIKALQSQNDQLRRENERLENNARALNQSVTRMANEVEDYRKQCLWHRQMNQALVEVLKGRL